MTSPRVVEAYARYLWIRGIVDAQADYPGDPRTDRVPDAHWNQAEIALAQEEQDQRPHSRACGFRAHAHGSGCSADCPTCHGQEER